MRDLGLFLLGFVPAFIAAFCLGYAVGEDVGRNKEKRNNLTKRGGLV